MTNALDAHDYDRVFLEKLLLAVRVLLDLDEEPGTLNDAIVAELFLLKDRIEHALLGSFPREKREDCRDGGS